MSKFTTEVRYICENYSGYDESQGLTNVEDIITTAAPKIFDNFPIYDESYRLVLETKILRHYYTREISEETVALWKLRLNDKMNLIMPFYNKLYKSELLDFNPFYDVDLTRDYQRKDVGSEDSVDSENIVDKNTGSYSGNKVENGSSRQDNDLSETVHETGSGKNKGGTSENLANSGERSLDGQNNNTETRNLNDVTTKTGSEINTPDTWDLYSDTPQGSVIGVDLIDDAYLTNARRTKGTDTKSFEDRQDSTAQTGNVTNNGTNKEKENTTNLQTRNENKNEEFENENVKIRETSGGVSNNDSRQESTINVNETQNERNSQRLGASSINNMSEYIEHVVGKQGGHTFSEMLLKFRETFLNIDRMIIKELEPLFFGLWE